MAEGLKPAESQFHLNENPVIWLIRLSHPLTSGFCLQWKRVWSAFIPALIHQLRWKHPFLPFLPVRAAVERHSVGVKSDLRNIVAGLNAAFYCCLFPARSWCRTWEKNNRIHFIIHFTFLRFTIFSFSGQTHFQWECFTKRLFLKQ